MVTVPEVTVPVSPAASEPPSVISFVATASTGNTLPSSDVKPVPSTITKSPFAMGFVIVTVTTEGFAAVAALTVSLSGVEAIVCTDIFVPSPVNLAIFELHV